MEQVLKGQHEEREAHIKTVVSTLKSIADATDGSGNPRAALERVVAKGVVHGIRSMKAKDGATVKASSVSGPIEREAITLAALAERRIGPAFVEYDPESLRDIGFDNHEITKLMAAKIVLYDTHPFTDWYVFEKVAIAMNDREVQFDQTQDLTIAEIAWAVDAMRYIDPHTPFSDEVIHYIVVNAKEEGFVTLPPILSFAEDALYHQASDYGRAVADRIKKGEQDEEAVIQRKKVALANDYVNYRHKKLLRELQGLRS